MSFCLNNIYYHIVYDYVILFVSPHTCLLSVIKPVLPFSWCFFLCSVVNVLFASFNNGEFLYFRLNSLFK